MKTPKIKGKRNNWSKREDELSLAWAFYILMSVVTSHVGTPVQLGTLVSKRRTRFFQVDLKDFASYCSKGFTKDQKVARGNKLPFEPNNHKGKVS